jgi:hypothetical protein
MDFPQLEWMEDLHKTSHPRIYYDGTNLLNHHFLSIPNATTYNPNPNHSTQANKNK